MAKLFSYVVASDSGYAPNPTGGYCTLANCKCRSEGILRRNVVELAEKGDWIVGTGGKDTKKSSGNGTLIFAMKVEKKSTLEEYYNDKRFKGRKGNDPDYSHRTDTCALISRHYWYFGRNAVKIPPKFRKYPLEKKGQGFRNHFSEKFVQDFTQWLEEHKKGVHGKPCCNGDNSCEKGCKKTHGVKL